MSQTDTQLVTKTMTIGDVVAKYPAATEVLMGYGLHCVGCHVNGMESIEEGAAGHGMSDEEIDKMVADVNDAIANGRTIDEEIAKRPLITITEAAARKVQDIASKDGKAGWQLKVFVMPGGCSGFRYGMDFIEKPQATDIFVEQHGMKVYVEADSVQFIKGCIIDYVETLQDQGFKIDNPNATRSCGCGSSFS